MRNTPRKRRSNPCEDGYDVEGSSSSRRRDNENLAALDHEIAQLTKLRSRPHDLLSRDIPGRLRAPVSTVKMLIGREGNYSGRGRFSSADGCHVLSRYLPVSGPWKVDHLDSRAYVSQFSEDGSFFIAGCQGSQIRVYDVENGWKILKDILAKNLSWTITDTCLSPDQRFLVYSSLSPIVHIVNVGSSTKESVANVTEVHDGLDFSGHDEAEDMDFGIFAVKFSTDGREVVASSNDNAIYVYDIEANKRSLRIPAHQSDVNTVCFGDETGHIIYSGSDDHLCKVWDRRCFLGNGKAAGVLMGHMEGITFIDSRRDGRYFISNGKDQCIKLWDIRKMSTNAKHNCTPKIEDDDWDYRWMPYPPQARTLKHPLDQSLSTYRGHQVLCTLIRCYFSPEYSTGKKYIYTGSADEDVYVYDLVSGAQVARLKYHDAPVRDCSWHPQYPMIVSSAWDGMIVRWEFPGNGSRPSRRPGRRRRGQSPWARQIQ